jgi:hypothetical protein
MSQDKVSGRFVKHILHYWRHIKPEYTEQLRNIKSQAELGKNKTLETALFWMMQSLYSV